MDRLNEANDKNGTELMKQTTEMNRLNEANDRNNEALIMYIATSSHTQHTPGDRLLSGNHFQCRI
jgi:hypothetical protein